MVHPDWVLKHKLPNTEIRNIRGRYYMYNITSIWCPEKKRAKKKTLNQVGVIDPEYGLIPTGMSRKGRIPAGESKLKTDASKNSDFLDNFQNIEDPRSERNKLYPVSEILFMALLAVICGAEGWQDIENYGKAKLQYLRGFLDYANGVPSDDTFRRFFRTLKPDYFKEMFREWVGKLASAAQAKVIAIDGKSNRRTFDDNNSMIHMVSAYATEARLVLGQEKVEKKSNEITAIPKLLQMLDIKGHIITIDAMGCQVKIANQIVEQDGDYILALKGNQASLSDDVRLFFEDAKQNSQMIIYTDYDKGHGRVETRECSVCHDVQWLRDLHPKWNTIKSIVKIRSKREFKDVEKSTEESRYYISSLEKTSPEAALLAIRQHWGIENSLHWVLDMSFNEDYSRIRKGNAPQIMAIMRHIALNLLQSFKKKQESLRRHSIKGLRKVCSWDDKVMSQLLLKSDLSP